MIPITDAITVDQEADYYRAAFFHKVECTTTVIKPRIQIPATSYSVVCWKCGRCGHIATKCDGNLPTLAALRAESEKDLQAILREKRKDPTLLSDEFGFYATTGEDPISTRHSWDDSRFCVNCGKSRHKTATCPHLTMHQLFSDLKDVLNPHSRYSQKDIKDAFLDAWERT